VTPEDKTLLALLFFAFALTLGVVLVVTSHPP
jgi:hypothetical protein